MLHNLRAYTFCLFGLLLFLGACAPTTLVRPLKAKQKLISAGLGGPLIHFAGTVIPIPFTQLDLAYGYSDRLSLQGGINTTSLLFGVAQLRLNPLYEFGKPKGLKPGLSGYFQQHLLLDRWKNRFSWYPEPGFNLYWDFQSEKHLLFWGASGWMELRKPSEPTDKQATLLPVLNLGYQHNSPKWNWTLESKWILPGTAPGNQVVEYISPGNSGAIGLYLSLSRKF